MKTLCEPLLAYFPNTNDAQTIQGHLIQYGLFYPDPLDKQVIQKMISHDYWEIVIRQFRALQDSWKGPKVPVFIFPSDFTNDLLLNEFNGLSGLSYPDKIFLFITHETTYKQLEALLTHEYSHVFRLQDTTLNSRSLTLSDALVLEGIAEVAVEQLVGHYYLAKATCLYSRETAQTYWKEWIEPNQHLLKSDHQHDRLMYGGEDVPKWAGYNIGFHLVKAYMQKTNPTLLELLGTPTDKIIEKSGFSKNVR